MSRHMWAFFVVLMSSLVLYVYRFAFLGVNLSLFRVVFLGWLGVLTLDMARGRVRMERRHWPFAAIGAGIALVNAIDFLVLSDYPALRRDIANHLVNVTLAGLILVYVDTDQKIRGLLRALALSSVLTTAVTVYASLTNTLPFEGVIRTLGSDQARTLPYINDDLVFERATSSFFDPNFYGIYSMLVLVAIIYLWLHDRPARYLSGLFVLNLVCLTLTLSRTAVVGLFVALAVTFVLSKPSRWFALGAAAATIALLYASTAFQSYDTYAHLKEQGVLMLEDLEARWESLTADTPAPDAPAAGPRSAGTDSSGTRRVAPGREVQERVASSRSLATRLEYIERGLAAFRSSPIWGGGSAALVTPTMPWSSAHVTYLTLLARYGVLGAAVYLAFLAIPLALVWLRPTPQGPRLLTTLAIVPLLVVYLSYDIFLFFEIQYVFFGLAYSVALNRPWTGSMPGEPAPAVS